MGPHIAAASAHAAWSWQPAPTVHTLQFAAHAFRQAVSAWRSCSCSFGCSCSPDTQLADVTPQVAAADACFARQPAIEHGGASFPASTYGASVVTSSAARVVHRRVALADDVRARPDDERARRHRDATRARCVALKTHLATTIPFGARPTLVARRFAREPQDGARHDERAAGGEENVGDERLRLGLLVQIDAVLIRAHAVRARRVGLALRPEREASEHAARTEGENARGRDDDRGDTTPTKPVSFGRRDHRWRQQRPRVKRHLALLALGHLQLELFVATPVDPNDEGVRARIDRNDRAERGGIERCTITQDASAGGCVLREHELQARKARGYGVGAAPRERAAIVLRRERVVHAVEAFPRRRETPALLFAVAEVQQRARSRIEAVALLELRARGGEVARVDRGASFAKQSFGEHRVVRARRSKPTMAPMMTMAHALPRNDRISTDGRTRSRAAQKRNWRRTRRSPTRAFGAAFTIGLGVVVAVCRGCVSTGFAAFVITAVTRRRRRRDATRVSSSAVATVSGATGGTWPSGVSRENRNTTRSRPRASAASTARDTAT